MVSLFRKKKASRKILESLVSLLVNNLLIMERLMKILANFFSYAFICTAVFAWTTTAFGQFNSFFDGSCTIDGVTTPIDAELMQPEVSVFSCVEFGIPRTG